MPQRHEAHNTEVSRAPGWAGGIDPGRVEWLRRSAPPTHTDIEEPRHARHTTSADRRHPARNSQDLRCERDGRHPSTVPARIRRRARPRGGVREGDLDHAADVATQLETLSIALHNHHEGEDERLWGPLEQRAPSCASHVERMKAQHAQLLVHLVALDDALPAWRGFGVGFGCRARPVALAGVNAAIAVHLPDEEANIVPVMEYTITQAEVGLVLANTAGGPSRRARRGSSWARSWPPSPTAAMCGCTRTCPRRCDSPGAGSASRSTRSTARPSSGPDSPAHRSATPGPRAEPMPFTDGTRRVSRCARGVSCP